MFIRITKQQLVEIGKKAFDSLEWIPFVKEYPNLRGVFSKDWGDISNPRLQLKNFIISFPTEEMIFNRIIEFNEKIQLQLNKKKTFLPTETKRKEIYEGAKALLKKQLVKMDDINDIYKIEPDKLYRIYYDAPLGEGKLLFSREFVVFYLKHVKVLSRNDLFRACEKIGGDIFRDYHTDFWRERKKEWDYFKNKWDTPGFEFFKYGIFGDRSPSFIRYMSNIQEEIGDFRYYIHEIYPNKYNTWLVYPDDIEYEHIIQYFVDYDKSWAVISSTSEIDLAVIVWVKDIFDFYQFWEKTLDIYEDYFAKYAISIYIQGDAFLKNYLFPEINKSDNLFYSIKCGGTPFDFDEIDYKILNEIAVNARAPLIDLAEKMDCSAQMVNYRLKNLMCPMRAPVILTG